MSKDKNDVMIQASKNGPYIVSGKIPLFENIIKCNDTDIPVEWVVTKEFPVTERYVLCRCGHSNTTPFCDGTHIKINFNGTETAGDESYLKEYKTFDGPELKLDDIEKLCSSARFCHRGGDIWDQIQKSDDSSIKKNCIRNSCDCPSGRLILHDKKLKEVYEPKFNPSLAVIMDPFIGVISPIWVKGGIPVKSADGKTYAVRNRVTLCRCGKSANKPFCDSSHWPD